VTTATTGLRTGRLTHLLCERPLLFYAFTMVIDKQFETDGGATPAIAFTLDPGSGVPTYLQLVHQVEHAVRLGYLTPGDQLPRVREVVAELAINPNTVLKAYRELEHKGLTAGRPGQGTFVVGVLDQIDLAGLTVLRESLLGWLSDADAAGLDQDGVVALFSSTARDFAERRGQGNASGAKGSRRRSAGGAA
jgi:GntR family transcriptional regulator